MNGMFAAAKQRNNVIHREAIANVFIAIRAAIAMMFENANPLFFGKRPNSVANKGAATGIVGHNIVSVPLVALGTHLAVVREGFVGHAATLTGASVAGSRHNIALENDDATVTGLTHFANESSVRGMGRPANNTRAIVLSLRFLGLRNPTKSLVTSVAHLLLVVTGRINRLAHSTGAGESLSRHKDFSYRTETESNLPATVWHENVFLSSSQWRN